VRTHTHARNAPAVVGGRVRPTHGPCLHANGSTCRALCCVPARAHQADNPEGLHSMMLPYFRDLHESHLQW
jgi:hypothetical protein